MLDRPTKTMATSAFGQTLQYITTIKLEELERQRDACTKYVQQTIEQASAHPDPIKRARVLVRGIDNWKGLGSLVSAEVNLTTYKQWLHQAQNDPSITPSQVEIWANKLEKELKQAVTRYDYAKLFGDLLGEWLKSGDSLAVSQEPSEASSTEESAHVKGMRKERSVQQDRIQELIFEAKHMDVIAIEEYLEDLFSEPDALIELTKLRTRLDRFGTGLLRQQVYTHEMDALIKSLLSRDLLSPEKTATLKSFLGNSVIIEEVTSVLNMQLASLDQWEWPEEGVKLEMRRHLSGKYRAYMDNEIIQALLFQYIGMTWSAEFKDAFRDIALSRAWKVETPVLSREKLKRRKEFLDEDSSSDTNGFASRGWGGGRGTAPTSSARANTRHLPNTIEANRHQLQLDQFFMTQLPKTMQAETPYDEEPVPGEQPNQGANAQQVLLRLVSTEAHLKQALHGSCTIMRADLEWFGPSLPHDSILTVLKFFGMPVEWLTFIQKWLNARLRFDDKKGVSTRLRGVPIAHSLSVLCGEAVLFAMDFAVNQRAGGLYVYRIYDDFWFYTHNAKLCADAWREMTRYAALVGITFNMKKTGGVCVGADLELSLPKGVVGWGFLSFDSGKGRFVVDQGSVDTHIAELRRQLSSAKSVFGFVNALNKARTFYLEFFRRNFAQPAYCFGLVHIDEVISTFARILKEVFAETNGSVVLKVQQLIETRFCIKDIPAGWCFLPISKGGLEIVNPIVSLMTVRDHLRHAKPETNFITLMNNDKYNYETAKEAWLSGQGEGKSDTFMSFEEYVLGRETRLASWGEEWSSLQNVADAWETDEDWNNALYQEEIVEEFGSLKIVDSALIPVGMLSAFKSAKIAWDS
ncbi:hypothetical protein BDZ89DRAFT_1018497 [Hymenopellis radicata]|nr:hypothetical protein BDZ89DRAFT_1018497 [Hymenopellis radicata]